QEINPFDEEPSKLLENPLNVENTEQAESTVQKPVQVKNWSSEQINEPNATVAIPVTTSSADASNPVDQQNPPSVGPSVENKKVEKTEHANVQPHEGAHFSPIADKDKIKAVKKNVSEQKVVISSISKWIKNEKKLFFDKIKNIELKWQNNKVEEIKNFLLYLEKRWLSYKGNVDTKVSKDFEKKFLSWQDDQWKNWIYSEGTDLLINQFNMWLKFSEVQLKFNVIEDFKDWVLEKESAIYSQSWPEKKQVKKLNKILKNAQTMQKEVHKHVDNFHKPVNKKLFNTFVIWKNDFIERWLEGKIYDNWLNEIHN
ncbi:tryptophan-rich antigen, putative, partial [Hepatocystis sp. ex Piliocolobus tephrosceles]